jgi:hypothetical protein
MIAINNIVIENQFIEEPTRHNSAIVRHAGIENMVSDYNCYKVFNFACLRVSEFDASQRIERIRTIANLVVGNHHVSRMAGITVASRENTAYHAIVNHVVIDKKTVATMSINAFTNAIVNMVVLNDTVLVVIADFPCSAVTGVLVDVGTSRVRVPDIVNGVALD